MPTVIIRRGEVVERTVSLGDRPLVIGRSSESDLILDHSSVSRRHASVAVEAGVVVVRDLGSSNGMYLDRERVVEWRAVPGTPLGIGIFQLEIADTPNPTAEAERTRLLSAVPVAEIAPSAPPAASIIVKVIAPNGSSRDHTIVGDSLLIGRDADSSLRLDDRMVSRSHAQLVREGGRWKIVDLGSTNGFSVNGNSAKEATLTPGDEIAIGPYRLVFEPAAEASPLTPASPKVPRIPRKTLQLGAVAAGVLVACVLLIVAFRNGSGPGPATPGSSTREPGGMPQRPPESAPVTSAAAPLQPPAPSSSSPPPSPLPLPESPAPPAVAASTESEAAQFRKQPAAALRPAKPPAPRGDSETVRLDNLLVEGKKAFKNFDCAAVSRLHEQARSINSSRGAWQVKTLAGLDGNCESAKKAEELRTNLLVAHELEAAGKPAEAQAAYRAILSVSPGHPEADARLKAIERAEQDDRGKKAILERDRAKISRLMEDAIIYDGLGDSAKACSLWKEALALQPDGKEREKVEKNLARCRGGAGQ